MSASTLAVTTRYFFLCSTSFIRDREINCRLRVAIQPIIEYNENKSFVKSFLAKRISIIFCISVKLSIVRIMQELESGAQADKTSRRERRMHHRRREILRVAARLFAQFGYEGTTLDMIADELGLSKPGLYHYIKSKDDVLMQIHEDMVQGIIDQVQASILPTMSPQERLWHLIVAHTLSICAYPERRAFNLFGGSLLSKHGQDVIELRDRYQRMVESIIVEGIACGIFHVTDATLATLAVLGTLNWIPRWYSPDGPLSAEKIGEYFANILIAGLITPFDPSLYQSSNLAQKKPDAPRSTLREIKRTRNTHKANLTAHSDNSGTQEFKNV